MPSKIPPAPLFLLLALLFVLPVAHAAEQPRQPVLRLETGMHTALVRAISVDRGGRYLASASDDKTVRLWDLARNGEPASAAGEPLKPLRVLRPPIGEGHEGKLNAVALSPDGASVACGGWTGWDRDRKGSVYLFDRADGSLVKRLSGFPEVVKGLAFSADGAYLAVTLGGKGGLFVLRCADWKPALVDRGYGGDVYGVAFSADGRLATTSWDGYVRLYDHRLKALARQRLISGERPYGVAFSPDGSRIAVGSVASARVELLSGQELRQLGAAAGQGPGDGALSSVAWGRDGELYAAGSCRTKGGFLVRRWSGAGLLSVTDHSLAAGDILALAPLPEGGVAFAGAAPELGLVAQSGERLMRRLADSADFRDSQPDFRVSADGATVQFGYGPAGSSRARFSIAERLLDAAPRTPATGLTLPLTTAPGLVPENWLNGTAPLLNGRPLPLDRFETARSLALLPGDQGVVLGTDWNLRCFDRHGKQRWSLSAPGIAWGLNLARDGRLVVAAFGDGTIRWYRAADGRELLALFPHRDQKRWLLWTPSGYYDASAGAEELVGWHLNQGPDQAADFFPVSRLRAAYCRPDVVARVLGCADEAQALQAANAAAGLIERKTAFSALLPPLVAIRTPAERSVVEAAQVSVAFSVRSPSGEPVTGLRVLVAGRPVPFTEKKGAQPGEVREITVDVPEGESEISVIAENRHAASEPATVRVSRAPGPRAETISFLPNLYVLAVGVGAYPDRDLALDYAAKDARDFAALMLGQKGGLYGEVSARLLTDAAATRQALLEGLAWLRREAKARDTAVVFLSGHGVSEPGGAYYYLPVDGDPNQPAQSSVVFSAIRETLMSLPGKALLFVDTCHAGDVMGGRRAAAVVDSVVNELASAENGVVVFASSTGQQSSLEDERWGNGAFTKALAEGIGGKADYTGKGKITVTSLDLWLSERVTELTEGRQTPTTAKPRTIPDFPLAVRK